MSETALDHDAQPSGPVSPSTTAEDGLVLRNVSKAFGSVQALDDVTLEVRSGEVHGLIGENGAGKSTLMGVAAGSLRADSGRLVIGGAPIAGPTAHDVRELGLAIVYQQPALALDLTVLENLRLGVPRSLVGDVQDITRWARAVLSEMALDVPLRTLARELTVGQCQQLEIAKALAANPSVLILDEPTESLAPQLADLLFEKIRRVADRGGSVIYISHRLPDVERLCDRFTVMRDGRTRGTFDSGDLDEDQLLALIVGRPVESAFPAKAQEPSAGEPLSVRALSGRGFGPVDVELLPGEIIGLAGIEGQGQREFLRALAGLVDGSGTAAFGAKPIALGDPMSAARTGVAYIPADRSREGLYANEGVRFNLSVTTIEKHAWYGLVRRAREKRAASAEIARLGVKTASAETPVGKLSGGNQQKVVVGRALLSGPKLVLAEEPTQGVDAGARVELYRELRAAAERGAVVLVLSTDGVELEHLCDRVLVFSGGRPVADMRGENLSEDGIARAAVTSTAKRTQDGQGRARSRWARFANKAAITSLIVTLGAYTAAQNDAYLGPRNITAFLFALSILALVGLAQFLVVMVGGIDLSVGPLTSLVTVVASFYLTGYGNPPVVGILIVLGLGAGVGLANGLLIRLGGVSPIIATLVAFFGLQGIALMLRPQAGGSIDPRFAELMRSSIGHVPIVTLGILALFIVVEIGLVRLRAGLAYRAVGSSEPVAMRLGVHATRVHLTAYLAAGVLGAMAGLLLSVQVGVGDAGAGTELTLAAIAAVVVGGTALVGGRGSAIGVLLAAVLLQQITNVSTFLQLSPAWQYWLLGLLTLGSAALLSRGRPA